MKNLMLLLFVVTVVFSCSPSTEIVKTWKEPGATVTPGPTNKVLVVAMVKDETSRRLIEDQLAQRISANTPAVASYTMLTSDLMKAANDEVLTKMLTEGKFTHIMLMRLADIEKETSYVQGSSPTYYGGYGRYYGYGAGAYSSPGYYTTDKNYFIESTIYSVVPDKLLWTSTTKTVNPSKIDKTVTAIADIVVAQMKKDGFLK